MMNKCFCTVLLVVSSLIFGITVSQTGWAAIIVCPNNPYCYGTGADDVIIGMVPNGFIRAGDGSDIVIGVINGNNVILGEGGNDTIIGGNLNDVLQGNLGNDRIEGGLGDDTIEENQWFAERFEGNDDISGGPGNDYISAGGGSDRIFGGPGNDIIGPSSYNRDFVKDEVDCGSGTDTVNTFYSGDGDTAVYCETVNNSDG